MTKTEFLFPWQGSQSLGMLASLAGEFPVVGETFAQASGILRYDLWGTIESLKAQGVDSFVECGPGEVLTGLNRRFTREPRAVAQTDRAANESALTGSGT
jgi:malonyl CoA-acyl carrier protein transacylase